MDSVVMDAVDWVKLEKPVTWMKRMKNRPDLEIVNTIRYDTLDYINVRPKADE